MEHTRRKLLAAAVGAAAVVAAGCGHVAPLPADAERQPDPAQASAAQAPREEKVFVTGSRIPQRVDTGAGLPATTSPLRIYSRRDLTSTGRPETADALRQLDPSIP